MKNGKSSFGIENGFGDFCGQAEQNVLNTKTIFPNVYPGCGQRYFCIYPFLIEQTNGYTP